MVGILADRCHLLEIAHHVDGFNSEEGCVPVMDWSQSFTFCILLHSHVLESQYQAMMKPVRKLYFVNLHRFVRVFGDTPNHFKLPKK